MLQTLRQTRTQIEADLLISCLRAAGLHPADLRVWPHVTLAGADLFYSVNVPEDEAEAADQIVRSRDEGEQLPLGSAGVVALRIAVGVLIACIGMGMLIP